MGSVTLVHAHGDNIETLQEHLPRFTQQLMLTTQTRPFDGVFNFGGFTDGDRAVCVADHFGARTIRLVGFDFDRPTVKEGKDVAVKKRKLAWARRIIETTVRAEVVIP
jgi:hypothetical protein